MSKRERARVRAAIAHAEATTGLQFCVFLGALDDGEPRAHAESLFRDGAMHELPAVLIVVAPAQRRIEIVTSEDARGRISDAEAAIAIAEMTGAFVARHLGRGLVAGIDHLARAAGPAPAEATLAATGPGIVDE